MKEIGLKIIEMVMEFFITKMAAIMKDNGRMIKLMEKVYLNMQMEIFTKEVLKKILEMVWQISITLMDQNFMENGEMIRLMAREQ